MITAAAQQSKFSWLRTPCYTTKLLTPQHVHFAAAHNLHPCFTPLLLNHGSRSCSLPRLDEVDRAAEHVQCVLSILLQTKQYAHKPGFDILGAKQVVIYPTSDQTIYCKNLFQTQSVLAIATLG